MNQSTQYEIYRSIIKRVLDDNEGLPSLPTITLKIRQAIDNENTTVDTLAQLVSRDPALTALLMKCAASPLYRTVSQPTTIQGVISLMGMPAVGSVVMTHSLKSLFPIHNTALRKLFNHTWKRQITKGSMAALIGKKLYYHPAEEALTASLLSEVGTLAVLSAFSASKDIPSEETYFALCRDYSKSLGTILLTKWNVDKRLIDTVKNCGQWQYTEPGKTSLIDVINLALYQTVMRTKSNPNLPRLKDLAAYQKLLSPFNAIDKDGGLLIVSDHQDEIDAITGTFR